MSIFLSLLRKNFVAFIVIFPDGSRDGFFRLRRNTLNGEEKLDASEVIIHHVLDDHIWHLWDHGGTIYLPVIVYSSEKGLDVFSSHHFYDEHHNMVEYNGYKLDHDHIYLSAIT